MYSSENVRGMVIQINRIIGCWWIWPEIYLFLSVMKLFSFYSMYVRVANWYVKQRKLYSRQFFEINPGDKNSGFTLYAFYSAFEILVYIVCQSISNPEPP